MNLLNELQKHSDGMTELKLSIGITNGEKTTRLFYDGKILSEVVPDYIYEIGSVSKTFTTGLLCKAISENKISLESRVSDFFPELASDGVLNPTILELATYRSGYSNDLNMSSEEAAIAFEKRFSTQWSGDNCRDNPYRYITENDLIAHIAASDENERENGYCYSNVGFGVLGLLLSRAYNKSFDELLSEYIKTELKLNNTSIDRPFSGYISGYNSANESCGNWLWNGSGIKAAGCIYSTLGDMLDYLKIYMNNEREYLALSHRQAFAACENHDFSIGLGWIKSGNVTWHNGGTGCFHSFIGFREDIKRGVVMLENYNNSDGMKLDEICMRLLWVEDEI